MAESPGATGADGVGQEVTVERFIDGDSLELRIDGQPDEVRLIGINAPEGDECLGDTASERLAELLGSGPLRVEGDERDDFGRRLVVLRVGDLDVSLQLVTEGLAVARDQSGHTNAAAYEVAEAEAQADQRGIWAAAACGEATTAQIVVVELMANAPGPDNENPNGEWIELRNDGETTDLGEWVVRDESTRHRYEFPAGYVFETGATLRLFSGCGTETATERYWCKVDDAVWNNGGDTAFVLDANGSTVAVFGY